MEALGWLLIVIASCDKGPPPSPQAQREPEPTPLAEEKPFRLRLHLNAWIYVRSSELPPDLRNTGFARDLGVHRIEIVERNADTIVLTWQMKERFRKADEFDEAILQGAVRSDDWSKGRTMFLPVHWEGRRTVREQPLLWMTPEAFSELRDGGRTTWNIGLEKRPEDGSAKLVERTTRSLVVSEKPRTLPVLRAESAVAEFVVLDDPLEPLLLAVRSRVPTPETLTPTRRTRLTHDYEVTEVWISP